MTCICHPGPYHKPACPCQAAYVASRQRAEDEDTTTPKEATAQARELVAAGYLQSSRKYRQAARIVRGHWDTPVTMSYRTFAEFRRMTGGAWCLHPKVLAFRAKARLRFEVSP